MHSSRMRSARSSSRLRGKGGVCISACWDTPLWAWPGHPPGLGLDTPPGVDLDSPPRCGPGLPLSQIPQPPPLGLGLDTPL